MSSAALAEIMTEVPVTVLPPVGAVMDTVGFVTAPLATVILTLVLVVVFPAASLAKAVIVCRPSVTAVLSQMIVYGAVAISGRG